MNISERLNKAGETCFNIATQRSFLVGAFFSAAAISPISESLALGCLGAPALYAATGFVWKASAKVIDYFDLEPPRS